ncbi:hypothetical protein GGR52DRAFT_464459 [Hypoxylon sp. FL1284]|nr:hypothetical protein GGR52DRAFT_464459 [Hypoxylon sp. FL1284]
MIVGDVWEFLFIALGVLIPDICSRVVLISVRNKSTPASSSTTSAEQKGRGLRGYIEDSRRSYVDADIICIVCMSTPTYAQASLGELSCCFRQRDARLGLVDSRRSIHPTGWTGSAVECHDAELVLFFCPMFWKSGFPAWLHDASRRQRRSSNQGASQSTLGRPWAAKRAVGVARTSLAYLHAASFQSTTLSPLHTRAPVSRLAVSARFSKIIPSSSS